MPKSNATVQQMTGWSAKHLGAKPGDDVVANAHGLGLRPGKQALAVSMALRPEGVSGAQIVMACGAPQLNRMRGLIADGHVKRDVSAGRNEQGHTVYRLVLTPKGEARIKRNAEAQAKAALSGDAPKPAKKAKAAKKPRKARAVKVDAPAPQAPVSEPAPQSDGASQA